MVVLVTCADLPDGDEDAALLTAALARLGIAARWQSWNDPAALWDGQLAVLRSTWDYATQRDDFLRWARAVPRLVNPYDLVEWNTDKVYLAQLQAAGIPTVPTDCFPPGTETAFPGGEVVVKPSVGAGSRGAGRFTSDRLDEATAHASELQAAGYTVVVQPYLDQVENSGETALIYIDGAFSHAITKGAMLPDGFVHPVGGLELYVEERISAAVPSDAELAVGSAAVAFLEGRGGAPLYTRVDLLPSEDGPVIGELEVTEPSLFLLHADGAADRFAAAIAARA